MKRAVRVRMQLKKRVRRTSEVEKVNVSVLFVSDIIRIQMNEGRLEAWMNTCTISDMNICGIMCGR